MRVAKSLPTGMPVVIFGAIQRQPWCHCSCSPTRLLPSPRPASQNSHAMPPFPYMFLPIRPISLFLVGLPSYIPQARGTGQVAGAVSCACSFFISTLFLLGPETLDSSSMRCPASARTCTSGQSFSDPIVLPCHREGLLFVLVPATGAFSVCTAVGTEAATAAVPVLVGTGVDCGLGLPTLCPPRLWRDLLVSPCPLSGDVSRRVHALVLPECWLLSPGSAIHRYKGLAWGSPLVAWSP